MTQRIRSHGASGPRVIVLHGGPGAPGSAAPLARGLAEGFRVLEPWQRGSGAEPLTVARHVADLDELIASRCADERPALVGWSWGAMLALAYAAAHPGRAAAIALVGCGTFDPVTRARLHATLDQRTDDDLRHRLDRLDDHIPDPAQRLEARYALIRRLYDYEPLPQDADEPPPPFDARAHAETWADMLRCQDEGLYPAAFAAIQAPVLLLHGSYDPHPGPLIRASLQPHLPQLEYRELPRCGHTPWRERHARAPFFARLRRWLTGHCAPAAPDHRPTSRG